MSSERVTNTDSASHDYLRSPARESRDHANAAHTSVPPLPRRATGIDSAWLVGLLQTTDSFFPTGSYAHSFGLEGFVQEGIVHDVATLREYLRHSMLPALR